MYKRLFDSLLGKSKGAVRSNKDVVNIPKDPLAAAMLARKSQNKLSQQGTAATAPRTGDLAGSSLFGDPTTTPSTQSAPGADGQPELTPEQRATLARRSQLDPVLSAAALDPRPAARKRWIARQVRQSVRKGGAISKETLIKRTEREHLARSHWMQTSLKKLYPLARQIQGKSVDEALVQLRFSRKKVAAEVAKHLIAARDEAIVTKGMGLEGASENMAPVEVKDYHGHRRTVTDPSALYIHRAFVGRGPFGKLPEFRARARMNFLRPPYTSISIELKEEKTRIRVTKEREEREARRKPWIHHPDRPIVQQRQYVMW